MSACQTCRTSQRRASAGIPRRGEYNIPPGTLIEVVSPSDRFVDVEDKARDYIRAGVDLVWVVVPSTRSVHVWRKDGSRAVLQAGETLTGDEVLPGLTIPVADLFEDDEEPDA
ncbi:MAG: Uma2 family endonuclease [Steroidobacteraceae bacterium]